VTTGLRRVVPAPRRTLVCVSWDCEAYGPDGEAVGALCFIAGELGERVCPDVEACHRTMAGERGRVYDRIQALAAAGDEMGVFLAGEFTSPEQILGGG